MAKLVYSSNGKVKAKKRRRIGEIPRHIREFKKSMSNWEQICFEVSRTKLIIE